MPEKECINGVNIVRASVFMKVSKGGLSWDFVLKIIELSKSHDIINPHLPMAHFGLALNSPAFALGYKTIPEEKIGPEGYQR